MNVLCHKNLLDFVLVEFSQSGIAFVISNIDKREEFLHSNASLHHSSPASNISAVSRSDYSEPSVNLMNIVKHNAQNTRTLKKLFADAEHEALLFHTETIVSRMITR